MPIKRLPGVYYDENVTYEANGEGSKIPIFIGKTGNTSTTNRPCDGTQTIKYTAYKKINTTLEDGGLGQEDANGVVPIGNELMATIKDFYEESKLLTSDDVGVPHIYVIDVGDGTDYKSWTNALMKAKSLLDAQVEIPVGGYMKEFTLNTTSENPTEPLTIREAVLCKRNKNLTGVKEDDVYTKLKITGETGNVQVLNQQGQKVDLITTDLYIDEDGVPLDYYVTIPQFMATIYSGQNSDGEYGLVDSARNLDLRYAFLTVKGATDEDLKKITSEFNESRIGLCEPLLFGKTMSRICCTPNNTEPGYFRYRSVNEGTFIPRTKKEMKDLQDAGIIFNRDEHINGAVYPKINLCVATSFVDNPRPADALFHARFNADNLLREIFEASYEFVKANETGSNIAYLQTKVNKLVNDKVIAEEMIRWDDSTEEGTRLRVAQSKEDPYALEISGQLQPVKCTIAIDVTAILRI